MERKLKHRDIMHKEKDKSVDGMPVDRQSNSSLLVPTALVVVCGAGLYVASKYKTGSLKSSDDSSKDIDTSNHTGSNSNLQTGKQHTPINGEGGNSISEGDASLDSRANDGSKSHNGDSTDEATGTNDPSKESGSGSSVGLPLPSETMNRPSKRLSRITISRNHMLDLATYDLSGDVNRDVNKLNELYNECFSSMVDDISSIDMINSIKSFIMNSPKYEQLVHVVPLTNQELVLNCKLSYQCVYGRFMDINSQVSPKLIPISKTKTSYEFARQADITSLTCSKDITVANGILNIESNSIVRINGDKLSLYLVFKPSINTSVTIHEQQINLIAGVSNFILLKGSDAVARDDVKDICDLVNEYTSNITDCVTKIESIVNSVLDESYDFSQVVHIYPGVEESIVSSSMNSTAVYDYMKKTADDYEKNYKIVIDANSQRHSPLPFVKWYTRAVFDRICRDTVEVYSKATVQSIPYTASEATNRVSITLTNSSSQENYLACCRWVARTIAYGSWGGYDNFGYGIFTGRTSNTKQVVNNNLGNYVTSRSVVGGEYPRVYNQQEVPFYSESVLDQVDFEKDGSMRFSGDPIVHTIDCEVAQCISEGQTIHETDKNFFIAVRLHKGDTISWHTHDGTHRSYRSNKLQDLVFPTFPEFFTGIIKDHNIDVNRRLQDEAG